MSGSMVYAQKSEFLAFKKWLRYFEIKENVLCLFVRSKTVQ